MSYYEVDVVRPGETEEHRKGRLQRKHEESLKRYEKEQPEKRLKDILHWFSKNIKWLIRQIIACVITAAITLYMAGKCEAYHNADNNDHQKLEAPDL